MHAGVRGENIQSVANFGASVLNEQLIPSLLTLNYGGTDHAPRFRPEPRRVEDKKANAERDAILLNAGVEFPKAYFHKRHEIPLPQDGEEVIGGKQGNTQPSVVSGQPFRQEPGEPLPAPEVAAASSQPSTQDSQHREAFASAVADDLRFALDRLARIAEIKDTALFEAKLREFAQDFPQLKADVLADPKSARALLPALVKGLEHGLAKPAVQGGESNPDQPRDDQGQFASTGGADASSHGGSGGSETPAQSQARGDAGMDKAIRTRADVIGAMHRPEVGDIDFKWGAEGDRDHKFEGGHGLSKIIAKHGAAAARKMPEVIAHGTLLPRQGNTQVITKDGWRAVLTKTEGRDTNHWLLSGYFPEHLKGEGR